MFYSIISGDNAGGNFLKTKRTKNDEGGNSESYGQIVFFYEKEILFFAKWYEDNFLNEREYEEKIKTITFTEQKLAFENYVNKTILRLENANFKKIERKISNDEWLNILVEDQV